MKIKGQIKRRRPWHPTLHLRTILHNLALLFMKVRGENSSAGVTFRTFLTGFTSANGAGAEMRAERIPEARRSRVITFRDRLKPFTMRARVVEQRVPVKSRTKLWTRAREVGSLRRLLEMFLASFSLPFR
jgi:hypothetical protein